MRLARQHMSWQREFVCVLRVQVLPAVGTGVNMFSFAFLLSTGAVTLRRVRSVVGVVVAEPASPGSV